MKYPYSVYKSEVEGHVFWVAESSCLPGCVGQGDTLDSAVNSLGENECEWIATAEELKMQIPEVMPEKPRCHSGKLSLRVSPAVHQKAAALAKKEGISLNQYLSDAIVSYNAELSTGKYLVSQFKDIISELRSLFFSMQSDTLRKDHSSGLSMKMTQTSPYKMVPSYLQ